MYNRRSLNNINIMRRSVAPVQNKEKDSANRRAILNHINKIHSMVNAPSRNTVMRQIVTPPVQSISDSEDDDYFDDYLMNQSSSESESDTEDYQQILRKHNRERAATEAEINSLPKVAVGKNILGVCAICLQEWKDKQVFAMLPCTHKFHEPCIGDWLNKKNSCPCCNMAVFQ